MKPMRYEHDALVVNVVLSHVNIYFYLVVMRLLGRSVLSQAQPVEEASRRMDKNDVFSTLQ